MKTTLLWFRQDLRLEDNPALLAAAERGAVVPVYVWSPAEEGDWPVGGAGRWWLRQSLARLSQDIEQRGARLVIRAGAAATELDRLRLETGADALYWNRRYEPAAIERDAQIKAAWRAQGCTAESFNANLLCEPWELQNKSGRPFQVFTPFWRHLLSVANPPTARDAPPRLRSPKQSPESLPLAALKLDPQPDWAGTMRRVWQPGEAGAAALLERFLSEALDAYSEQRDQPGRVGTSRLSPHLHWGEISPRRIWHATNDAALKIADSAGRSRPGTGRPPRYRGAEAERVPQATGAEHFLRELGWREFAHHLLYHFPETPRAPLRPEFAAFPWEENPTALRAWQRGETGVPLVDAGMRELWATGWMHNRVRMVVASFLVKHLLLAWEAGARWFWDTLVDADLANNTLGWQWSAGCGADAAPYFRIFNPVSQGEKFDPTGAYVRRWVPELDALPDRWLHRPWEAPAAELAAAGIVPGQTYPSPIVEHAAARERALAAFAAFQARRRL